MSSWLASTCSDFFGACVPPAFVFGFLDLLVCTCFKIAFLGKTSIGVRGGRVSG